MTDGEGQGDWRTEMAALEQAVAADGTQPALWHRLGRLRMRHRRWREAVAAFEAALALQPDRAMRHYWLGRARERCWDFAGARQAYAAAVAGDPQREDWAARLAGAEEAAGAFRPYTGTVVAHRGRAGDGAENAVEGLATVPAYATGLEVDVRLSRDGVPVLMHDPTVDRTTDGEGRVADLRWARLHRLAGAGGARVPTLEEYLAACAGHHARTVLLDLKEPTVATLSAVARVVAASPVAHRCVVTVRDGDELRAARKASDLLRLGCFGTTVTNVPERVADARGVGAELLLTVFGSRQYLAHREAVPQVRAAGLLAGASTINRAQALEAARVDGCDLLLTDAAEQLAHFTGAAARGD